MEFEEGETEEGEVGLRTQRDTVAMWRGLVKMVVQVSMIRVCGWNSEEEEDRSGPTKK